MVYILKGGRSSSRTPSAPKYEDKLLGYNGAAGMIERGALTDKDINFILESGDSRLVNALERKYEKEKQNADHVQRVYGSEWTNKDNDGNLYKDVATFDPKASNYSEASAKKMEPILKENL